MGSTRTVQGTGPLPASGKPGRCLQAETLHRRPPHACPSLASLASSGRAIAHLGPLCPAQGAADGSD